MQKLGIAVDSVPSSIAKRLQLESGEGVIVTELVRRSKFIGVKVGDVILSVNGQAVNSPEDFLQALSENNAGEPLTLVIRDENAEKMITIQ
jgi:S1-C subfamily serine protease